MAETAMGTAVESIALEGGLHSVLWAGPEEFGRAVKEGVVPVQGVVRTESVNLRFGFAEGGMVLLRCG